MEFLMQPISRPRIQIPLGRGGGRDRNPMDLAAGGLWRGRLSLYCGSAGARRERRRADLQGRNGKGGQTGIVATGLQAIDGKMVGLIGAFPGQRSLLCISFLFAKA
ncbi:hypothetical protein ACQJBY_062236 [Aegilops geniculata]